MVGRGRGHFERNSGRRGRCGAVDPDRQRHSRQEKRSFEIDQHLPLCGLAVQLQGRSQAKLFAMDRLLPDETPRGRIELDARHFGNEHDLAVARDWLLAVAGYVLVFFRLLAEQSLRLLPDLFDRVGFIRRRVGGTLRQMRERQEGVPFLRPHRLRAVHGEADVVVDARRDFRRRRRQPLLGIGESLLQLHLTSKDVATRFVCVERSQHATAAAEFRINAIESATDVPERLVVADVAGQGSQFRERGRKLVDLKAHPRRYRELAVSSRKVDGDIRATRSLRPLHHLDRDREMFDGIEPPICGTERNAEVDASASVQTAQSLVEAPITRHDRHGVQDCVGEPALDFRRIGRSLRGSVGIAGFRQGQPICLPIHQGRLVVRCDMFRECNGSSSRGSRGLASQRKRSNGSAGSMSEARRRRVANGSDRPTRSFSFDIMAIDPSFSSTPRIRR